MKMKNNGHKLLEGFLRSLSQLRPPTDDSDDSDDSVDQAPGGPGGINLPKIPSGCAGPLSDCLDLKRCFNNNPKAGSCGNEVKMSFLIREVEGEGNSFLGQLDFKKLGLQAFVKQGQGTVDDEHCRPCSMPGLKLRAYVYATDTQEIRQYFFGIGGVNVLTSIGQAVNIPVGISIPGIGCDGQCSPNKFDYVFTIAYFEDDNIPLILGNCPKVCDVNFVEEIDGVKNIAMEPGMCSHTDCEAEFPSIPTMAPPSIGRMLRRSSAHSSFGFNMDGNGACPC
jgi:hypothetical protein